MFQIDEDMTIYITRGDTAFFSVSAENNGELHKFQKGDVVRIKVFDKKNCANVAFQKDFPVMEECENVYILLTEEETKIGDVISKHKDYWYEIELNPYTNPQTIIGYDDDGAKIFRLFPEGKDLGNETKEEDVPVVDKELSLTSERPLENQAIARAMLNIENKIKESKELNGESVKAMEAKVDETVNKVSKDVERLDSEVAFERNRITNLTTLKEGSTTGDAELIDIRVDVNGKVHATAATAVREQIKQLKSQIADVTKNAFVVTNKAKVGQTVIVKSVDENGVPTTWETVDRTHWKEVLSEKGTALEETLVEFPSEMMSVTGIGTGNIVEGVEYTVIWNGTQYKCTAYTKDMSLMLGNHSIIGGDADTGEPFHLEMTTANTAIITKNTSDAESITIKVESPDKIVYHTIPPEYIKDMYYKEDGGGVEILPETTFTVDSSIDDDEMKQISPAISLAVGEEYTVKWNGVEYKCTATEFEMEGVTGVSIGMSIDGTGEFPFGIVNAPDMLGDNTMLMIADGSVSVTVSITQGGGKEVIHPIPEEYLGLDWLPKTTVNEIVLFEEQTVIVDGTESDIGDYKAYNLGLDKETRVKMVNEYETLLVSVNGEEKQLNVTRIGEDGRVYSAYFTSVSGEINVGDISVGSGSSVLAVIALPVGEHTIKVSHIEESIKPMPVEFLPDGVPYLTGSTELFPLTELTSPDNDGVFLFTDEIDLVVGEKYTVNWNGVDYETECVEIEEDVASAKCLGDIGLMSGETSKGEPFIFVYAPDMYADMGCTGMVNALDGSLSVSMSISEVKKIRKLPEELLPESLDGIVEKVDKLLETDGSGTGNAAILVVTLDDNYDSTHTPSEIYEFYSNGGVVFFDNKTGAMDLLDYVDSTIAQFAHITFYSATRIVQTIYTISEDKTVESNEVNVDLSAYAKA